DVTLSTQNAPRKLHGMLVRFHRSPRKRGMILLSSEPGAVCLLNSGSISSRDDVKRHRHSVLDLDEPARSGRRLDSEVGLLQDEIAGSRQRVVMQLDLERYDDRLHGAMKQQIACHVEPVRARVELLDPDLLRTEANDREPGCIEHMASLHRLLDLRSVSFGFVPRADGQGSGIDAHFHRRTREILKIDLHFPLNRTSDDLVLVPGKTADSSLADVNAKAAPARIDPERAGRCRGPEREQQEGAEDASGHTGEPGESSPGGQS